MLNLPNASLTTYLRELRNRKDEGLEDDLCLIYDMMNLSASIRTTLGWDQDPVWAEEPKIGGKYGISAAYSQHQALFQGLLGVQVPTVKSYVAQLKMLTSDTTSEVSEFKIAIYRIHAMCPKAGDIEDLKDLHFLPVRMPNGNIEMLRPVDTFLISDTREYQSTFHGKAPLPNFSLEENRKSYRVLDALGLEDRYISRIVEERVVVEQMEPESSKEWQGIFTMFWDLLNEILHSCVLHYNPKTENNQISNLRQRLQRAAVYESSGFKRILVLHLNEFTVTADSDNGLVHIENYSNMLRIYVPRDPKDRQQFYLSHLPNIWARFLGLKDREACLIFHLVSSNEIQLDCNGIVPAPVEDLTSVGSDASDDSEPWALSVDSVSEDSEVEDTTVRFHTPPTRSETAVEVRPILGSESFELGHRSRQPSYQVETAGAVVASHQASARSIRPLTLPQFLQLCQMEALNLLGRQATLPEASQVPTNASNGDRNTTTGWPFGVRSENQLAHDIKIGAAGELYVFELLQTLNLPGFGGHNWKSTIRREVTVHPDQDLAPWNGVETADLVYNDSSSALTSLLIRAGLPIPRLTERS